MQTLIDDASLAPKIAAYLGAQLGHPVQIGAVRRFPVGFSWLTYAVPVTGIANKLVDELAAFQNALFARAQDFLSANTFEMSTLAEVVAHFKERSGFVWVPWCGDAECEIRIKAEAGGVTIRSIDPDEKASGKCLVCGKPAKHRVALARAY